MLTVLFFPPVNFLIQNSLIFSSSPITKLWIVYQRETMSSKVQEIQMTAAYLSKFRLYFLLSVQLLLWASNWTFFWVPSGRHK